MDTLRTMPVPDSLVHKCSLQEEEDEDLEEEEGEEEEDEDA